MEKKKALLLSPMGSVHRRFNKVNIAALQRLGYQVHLAANFEEMDGPEKSNPEFVKECHNKGVITHNFPFSRRSLLKNLKQIRFFRRFLQANDFAIIHAHTETGGVILRLATLFTRSNRELYYTPHGMSFYKGSSIKSQMIYRPIERWVCGGMKHNLAMNMEELAILRKWNNKTALYVHGIGLDLSRFSGIIDKKALRHELSLSDDDFIILSVGELDDNKNHLVVLRTLDRMHNPRFHYVVCGVGPNKNKLEGYARKEGIETSLHLLGYRADIPQVISGADIFVFPSFHEGLPVSLMEAMAGGLTSVASKIRGNVDLIENGRNGYLFDPSSIDELEKIIADLYSDSLKRKRFSDTALIDVQAFSYDSVLKELVEFYDYRR